MDDWLKNYLLNEWSNYFFWRTAVRVPGKLCKINDS